MSSSNNYSSPSYRSDHNDSNDKNDKHAQRWSVIEEESSSKYTSKRGSKFSMFDDLQDRDSNYGSNSKNEVYNDNEKAKSELFYNPKTARMERQNPNGAKHIEWDGESVSSGRSSRSSASLQRFSTIASLKESAQKIFNPIPATRTQTRRIFFNTPIPHDAYPVRRYPLNKIRTAKYTAITFFPLALYYQFHNAAYLFFLIVAVITALPVFASSIAPPGVNRNPVLGALPLIIVLGIAGFAEAYADLQRTRQDKRFNERRTVLLDIDNENVINSVSLWRKIKKFNSRIFEFLVDGIEWLYNFLLDYRRYLFFCFKTQKYVTDGAQTVDYGDGPQPGFGEDYQSPDLDDDLMKGPKQINLKEKRRERKEREKVQSEEGNEEVPFELDEFSRPNTSSAHTRNATDSTFNSVNQGSNIKEPLTDVHEYGSYSHYVKNAKWKKSYWKEVCVGDIIQLKNGDMIPADCVLLCTDEIDGHCFVETRELDGETTLKKKVSLRTTRKVRNLDDLSKCSFEIESEPPNINLYTFSGTLKTISDTDEKIEPITYDNLLLRGSKLEQSRYALGMVVYSGRETKLLMNLTVSHKKRSAMIKTLNLSVWFNFAIILLMCAISAGLGYYNLKNSSNSAYFFEFGDQDGGLNSSFITFCICFALYQNLVPIGLYISVEITKVIQSRFIGEDLGLYTEHLDYPCEPKNMQVVDDMGQIEYIFSDKTGTLTQNVMELKKCSIAGKSYGKAFTDGMQGMELKKGGVDNSAKENESIQLARREMAEYITGSENPNPYFDEKNLTFVSPEFLKDTNGQSGEAQKSANYNFFMAVALCHSVITELKSATKKLIYKSPSPDEAALVSTARDVGFVLLSETQDTFTLEVNGERQIVENLDVLQFDSSRKRMSVIVKLPNGQIRLLCKGADTVIVERLAKHNDRNLLEQTMRDLDQFANEGFRTLLFAYRDLTQEEYRNWKQKYDIASTALQGRESLMEELSDKIERELILLGGTGVEDRLQEGVAETLRKLSEGGIKIWVLTGDKQETAVNIAYACNLLSGNMREIRLISGENMTKETLKAQLSEELKSFKLSGSLQELKAARKNHDTPPATHAIVVEGSTLALIMHHEDLKRKFLLLAKQCRTCICCRTSPGQKASVVKCVKEGLDVLTLAIGDGANDVAMIQEANVGIGLAGHEGRQAVMASDFGIGTFKLLARLVLVHGRWSYRRLGELSANYFYKNITWTLPTFWFQFYADFDVPFLFDWTYLIFNQLIFTGLPVIFIGLLDQDVGPAVSLQFPQLYREGILRNEWTNKKFWMYTLDAFYQSLISYFLPHMLFAAGWSVTSNGRVTNGPEEIGVYVAAINVFVTNYYNMFNMFQWDYIVLFMTMLSSFGVFMWTGLYASKLTEPKFYDVAARIYPQTAFWGIFWVTIVVCLLPNFLAKTLRAFYYPRDIDIVREIVYVNKEVHEHTGEYVPPAKRKRSRGWCGCC